jgi:drug/metabolite transporter (DMT)-like permease
MLLFVIAMSLTIGCSILGDFLVQQGATAVKGSRGESLSSIFRQWKTILGICVMTIHFGSFLLAIRLAPITLVVPLMASTYVINTILAGSVLKERITRMRWVGVMVIVVGVVVLGL